MEKKKSKIGAFLKYIGKTLSLTLLTILIIVGLALLFVFISAKVAKSKNAEPPINLYTIISPSMVPNINVYDVVVTVKTDLSKLKKGDVISYYSDQPGVNGMTITHRIVQVNQVGDEYTFRTKGDFNKEIDRWIVNGKDVVGKVLFKVPQLGRIQFFLGSKGGWLIAILIPALGIIAYDIYKIIKLVLIKQKIIAYQKAEDIPKEKSEIGTIDDVYENRKKENIEINNTNKYEEEPKQKETHYNDYYDEDLSNKSTSISNKNTLRESNNEYEEEARYKSYYDKDLDNESDHISSRRALDENNDDYEEENYYNRYNDKGLSNESRGMPSRSALKESNNEYEEETRYKRYYYDDLDSELRDAPRRALKEKSNEDKEEIVTIDDENIINSLDEQIKAMDEWKNKLDRK